MMLLGPILTLPMLKFVFKLCAFKSLAFKSLAFKSLAFKSLAFAFKPFILRFLAVFVGLLLLWPQSLLAASLASGTTVQWSPSAAPSPEAQETGFARAFGPQDWQFPQDFGPHPQYQTEWWYYTGNLSTPENRPFGFQLTFFRQALTPVPALPAEASPWRTPQLYSAHFTVSDIQADRFYQFERFSRGAVGLAGAQADPYGVWLQDWSATTEGDRVRLRGKAEGVAIDLRLTPTQPILQGNQGLSQKGPEPGNASYYYSQVQQATQGTVALDQQRFTVQGVTWMDHEYSTSSLSPGTVGWDWFSLQDREGSALMLYSLRRGDGSSEPQSAGTFVAATGQQQALHREEWRLEVLETWTSPSTGAQYPSHWRLQVPKLDLEMDIVPQMANQELETALTAYWEGAVRYQGTQGDRALQGQGYVELTGYATAMTRLLASP